jgi:hypothetical protein
MSKNAPREWVAQEIYVRLELLELEEQITSNTDLIPPYERHTHERKRWAAAKQPT